MIDTSIEPFTTFGLLRHGQTVWNLEKRIQGSGNSALTPEGIESSRTWGRWLATGSTQWQRIIVSPLQRARETAEIINKSLQLPIKIVDGLREQSWGQWEGLTIDEIKTDYAEELQKQIQRGWLFRPPEGESREDVQQRARAALEAECAENMSEHILVITHLGVIKSILYWIEDKDYLPENPQVGHKNRFHLVGRRNNHFSIVKRDIPLQDR